MSTRAADDRASDDRPDTDTDEEAVAAAVLGLDAVVALSAGPVGQFRSYLPGGRSVPGVRLDDEHVDVNVITRYGPSLEELGSAVAEALAPVLHGRTITVNVDDIVLPGEADPDAADSIVESAPVTDPSTDSDH